MRIEEKTLGADRNSILAGEHACYSRATPAELQSLDVSSAGL